MTPLPATWYCVDPLGRRHGPMPKAALQRAIAHRALGPDNLVWRPGLAQWQPLSSMTEELGALPPPVVVEDVVVAPTPAPIEQPVQAAEVSPEPAAVAEPTPTEGEATPEETPVAADAVVLPASPARAAARRRPGKRTLIALAAGIIVVIAVVVFVQVVTPAYRRYIDRSIVAAVMQDADALKPRIAQGYARMHRCAGNGEAGFGSPHSYADRYVTSVATGAYNRLPGQCALQLTLGHEAPAPLSGKRIWLISIPVSDPDRWTCITDLPAEIAPVGCKR